MLLKTGLWAIPQLFLTMAATSSSDDGKNQGSHRGEDGLNSRQDGHRQLFRFNRQSFGCKTSFFLSNCLICKSLQTKSFSMFLSMYYLHTFI
jgi:hypothetical protein